MKKSSRTTAGLLITLSLLLSQTVYAQAVTMYAADGRTLQIEQSEIEAYEAVGWYREPPYLMYAADGRTLYVLTSEIEAYEAVGWYREPLRSMYAKDGRVLAVPENEVEAYQNVGWFISREEANYNALIDTYNSVMYVQDYEGALNLCETALYDGTLAEGSIFYEDIAAKRRYVADVWRNYVSCPIGIVSHYVGKNSIGTPTVNINFRNLSYLPITAFKLTFDCYDAFGNPSRWTSYHSNRYEGYMNSIEFAPMSRETYYWTLYLQESTTNVQNMRITEVVYADGSKWVR